MYKAQCGRFFGGLVLSSNTDKYPEPYAPMFHTHHQNWSQVTLLVAVGLQLRWSWARTSALAGAEILSSSLLVLDLDYWHLTLAGGYAAGH